MLIKYACRGNRIKLKYIYTSKSSFLFCFVFFFPVDSY